MNDEQLTESADESSSDNLQAWIDRAKRAHELVDAVDLQKIAQHDDSEVGKLGAINNALNDLSQGGVVHHVEGVDEVVHELAPDDQRKVELLAKIADAGWASRLGRVLLNTSEGMELKPLQLIPHREGLPQYDACVAPEQAVGLGNYGLFISEQGIFGASIGEPASKHHWHIARSRPYDNFAELQKCIEQFSRTAFE